MGRRKSCGGDGARSSGEEEIGGEKIWKGEFNLGLPD